MIKVKGNVRVLKSIIGAVCIVVVFIAIATIFMHVEKVKKEAVNNLKNVGVAQSTIVDKQAIKTSLENIRPYENKLLNTVVDKKAQTEKFNNRKIAIKEYLADLSNYAKEVSEYSAAVSKINCTNEVNTYKSNVLNECSNFETGLQHEINFVNNKDTNEMNAASSCYQNFINIYSSNKTVYQNVVNLCK